MIQPRTARRPLRRFFSALLLIVIATLAAIILGTGTLLLQDDPILAAPTPPTPEDVASTRQLVHDIRSATAADKTDKDTALHTTAAQLNSAIRLGARLIPGLRGRISVDPVEVLGEISIPVPWWSGQKWLNVTGHVPEFDHNLVVSRVTVGGVNVPPVLALTLARTGANIGLGNKVGDKILQSATAMRIKNDMLVFNLVLDEIGKNGVMQGAFGRLRGAEMPSAAEIESYHLLIRDAMAEKRLKPSGSFLPYVHFALNAAFTRSTPQSLPNAYTAAIFGLAKACGARDFAMIVGRLAFDVADMETDWPTSCAEITFNDRIDSRRHFITAAALQAASNTGVAVSIGEFKELYDIISGAGGFDFTDMAANLSGIRMSNVLMQTPHADWPTLLTRLKHENDVIVPFDGIPPIMSETEFKARFGNVETTRYKAMIADIEARIDDLALYRTP